MGTGVQLFCELCIEINPFGNEIVHDPVCGGCGKAFGFPVPKIVYGIKKPLLLLFQLFFTKVNVFQCLKGTVGAQAVQVIRIADTVGKGRNVAGKICFSIHMDGDSQANFIYFIRRKASGKEFPGDPGRIASVIQQVLLADEGIPIRNVM